MCWLALTTAFQLSLKRYWNCAPRLALSVSTGALHGWLLQADAVDQLEAGRRHLRFLLVVGVDLQQRARRNPPVERGGDEAAMAVGALDIGTQPFARHVDAVAETTVLEAAAHVHRAVHRAVFAEPEQHAAQRVVGGALGGVVDDAARRGDAVLQAGQAFQHFEPLLVLQRDLGVAGDRQAILAVAARIVELEAADRELLGIADRVVGVADAGVVARRVGAAAHVQVQHAVARDDADGGGGEQHRRVGKARHGRGLGTAAHGGDDDFRHRRVSLLGERGEGLRHGERGGGYGESGLVHCCALVVVRPAGEHSEARVGRGQTPSCAFLRWHYPDQVRRVSLTRTAPRATRTPSEGASLSQLLAKSCATFWGAPLNLRKHGLGRTMRF
jgi:hypothetical protein